MNVHADQRQARAGVQRRQQRQVLAADTRTPSSSTPAPQAQGALQAAQAGGEVRRLRREPAVHGGDRACIRHRAGRPQQGREVRHGTGGRPVAAPSGTRRPGGRRTAPGKRAARGRGGTGRAIRLANNGAAWPVAGQRHDPARTTGPSARCPRGRRGRSCGRCPAGPRRSAPSRSGCHLHVEELAQHGDDLGRARGLAGVVAFEEGLQRRALDQPLLTEGLAGCPAASPAGSRASMSFISARCASEYCIRDGPT